MTPPQAFASGADSEPHEPEARESGGDIFVVCLNHECDWHYDDGPFWGHWGAQDEPPQALTRDELVKIVGTALYGWGLTEPNEATGFTARFESEQVADAIFRRLSKPCPRRTHDEHCADLHWTDG